MSLPAQNQKLVDVNGRIDPYWRRSLEAIDQVVTLLKSLSSDDVEAKFEEFKTALAALEDDSIRAAEFEAQKGQAETELNQVRDTINELGNEVKDATQASTKTRAEVNGQNEQRVKEINSLVAKANTSNASIVTLEEVVATEQSATATQFTQVQTSLDDNSASITEVSTSVDGIEAKKTISVNSNGDVDGYVQLSGLGGVSEFSVVADKFKIAHPNSGAPIPIFTATLDENSQPILQVNGYIVGDNISGGTITGTNIFGSEITGALFKSPGGGITIDGRDENNLSITLGA